MIKVAQIPGYKMRPVTLGDIERLSSGIEAALADASAISTSAWVIKHLKTIRDVISCAMDGDDTGKDAAISSLPVSAVFGVFGAAIGHFGFEESSGPQTGEL